MKLTVGSRGSNLAMAQTNKVVEGIKNESPGLDIEVKKIKTTGDKILHTTLHEIGGKALFVKELENALLEEKIDFAVHSVKDVPGEIYEDFEIFTVMERVENSDILISKNNYDLDTIPEGSTVATSSLRRKAQLLAYRKDLNVVSIRGNINTRLKKFNESEEIDAIILARAGIERLNIPVHISQVIPVDIIMPCVGQGALGVEILRKNDKVKHQLKTIQNEKVEECVSCERAFLKELGGSCHVPVGAYARYVEEDKIEISGVVASLDGENALKEKMSAAPGVISPAQLGSKLAKLLLDKGADKILAEIEQEVE